MDGRLELLSTIEKGRETGPPDRKCRILFSDLQPDRRKLDERKIVGGELVVARCDPAALGNRLRSSYHLPNASAERTMSEGQWQLEGSAAELFQRYLVPAITLKWAEDLVRRAQLRTGERVLDVACGTGVVARLAATKVRPGQGTGLDLNAGMLAVARSLPNDGAPINWTEGSALAMPFPSGHFDVVLCQQGLQFFPNQPRALRELHRVLREGGRAALSVYSPIERTPGANAFVQALDQVLEPLRV